MNMVDWWGLYNVKPVFDGEPSGNDGPIVTCYAIRLGLKANVDLIKEYYLFLALRPMSKIPVQRLPNKATPYPSRDTLLGWYTLGLLSLEDVIENDWKFSPVALPKFSFFKTLASFVLAVGEYRNFLWEKELTHSYRFLFTVPLNDRAYYYRQAYRSVPTFYALVEWIDKKLKPSNASSALIRWLKYKQLPAKDVWPYYFGEAHPITIEAMRLYEK